MLTLSKIKFQGSQETLEAENIKILNKQKYVIVIYNNDGHSTKNSRGKIKKQKISMLAANISFKKTAPFLKVLSSLHSPQNNSTHISLL